MLSPRCWLEVASATIRMATSNRDTCPRGGQGDSSCPGVGRGLAASVGERATLPPSSKARFI